MTNRRTPLWFLSKRSWKFRGSVLLLHKEISPCVQKVLFRCTAQSLAVEMTWNFFLQYFELCFTKNYILRWNAMKLASREDFIRGYLGRKSVGKYQPENRQNFPSFVWIKKYNYSFCPEYGLLIIWEQGSTIFSLL